MTFDCHNPLLLAEFWSAVLEYETENWPVIDGATSKPRDGGVPHIAFIKAPEAKTAKNRLHLDIQPVGRTMESEVERLVELGATRIDVFNEPSETWTVMNDPEGNEFCVLKPRFAES
ncbi:MAG TPA: VOC family protein [Dehalococcoidia bacterium]|nr:VOC family protein [Dehalococcoidia bacterium]